jgi:hypothetical protein
MESGISRHPDRLTRTSIEEVKNVQYLALTKQLRDYLAHAENNDLDFILDQERNILALSGISSMPKDKTRLREVLQHMLGDKQTKQYARRAGRGQLY